MTSQSHQSTGIRRSVVTTARHKTSFLEAGPSDGPVIVLVHGWPGIAEAWRHQLIALAQAGFRTLAPDVRGCGQSSMYRTHAAYAQREIVRDMIEFAEGLRIDKAVWVGHDWGSIIVSNIARHHPDRCIAVAGITQPFNSLERGLNALIPLLNRDIYPEAEFPVGQFDYMAFYHERFDDACASFEADVAATFKAVMQQPDSSLTGKPFRSAYVRKRGGWFGPDRRPAPDLPLETSLLDQTDLDAYVAAYSKTGFFGTNALYMNDIDNRTYFDSGPHRLDLPVLFLSGAKDLVCDTEHSDLAKPMREACSNLKYVVVDSAHWMQHERPLDISNTIRDWLGELNLPYTAR